MKKSLMVRLVQLVKAKLLDGTCAILAGWCQCQPGVQTHHEIRAGTLGRCLTTGWGRPKVEPGLDIEPPTGAQPVLLRMVLGSCGTPVSSCLHVLACTAQGKPAEGGERSKRGRRENKHRTLHCCQVTSGEVGDDQDDGGQRGEASHDSDSDHPVRLGSTGVFHPHPHCKVLQIGFGQK